MKHMRAFALICSLLKLFLRHGNLEVRFETYAYLGEPEVHETDGVRFIDLVPY